MSRWIIIAMLIGTASVEAAFDWDPFYERLQATNGATFQAWRPFYSTSVNGERWRKDYLWPLYTRKGFQDEVYGRFLFFGYSADFSPTTDRHRTWVIPFYFQGTSAAGEDYLAVFPIGGSIQEFLGRDRLWFVLFPLFARSSINDLQTTSVLWPIISKTSGTGVERFRVWPVYGRSIRDNEFEKTFVLWPVYTSVKYTNDRNPGGGFILFPIYGRVITERSENQWFFPPFFRFAQGEDERVVYAPWPFIQWSDGNVHKRYIWPLYGKKDTGTLSREFWLWPLIWNSKTEYAGYDLHRKRLVPVFACESEVVTEPMGVYEAGDVMSRYWKLWPLMSWERNQDQSRFRLLELWPLRHTAGIERNWAPLWTLYRRMNDGGEVGHHLLWGLYRQTSGNGGFEWSLLKGLARYKNTGTNRSFRFLFIRFGGEEKEP